MRWALTPHGAVNKIYAHIFEMTSMAQLHCYLPDEDAESFRRRAARAGMSVSRYLAELARKDLVSDWPEDYFAQLFGSDEIAPIQRGAQGDLEIRPALE